MFDWNKPSDWQAAQFKYPNGAQLTTRIGLHFLEMPHIAKQAKKLPALRSSLLIAPARCITKTINWKLGGWLIGNAGIDANQFLSAFPACGGVNKNILLHSVSVWILPPNLCAGSGSKDNQPPNSAIIIFRWPDTTSVPHRKSFIDFLVCVKGLYLENRNKRPLLQACVPHVRSGAGAKDVPGCRHTWPHDFERKFVHLRGCRRAGS